MEQIGQALARAISIREDLAQSYKSKSPLEIAQEKAEATNATKGHRNEEDGYDCPKCMNRGYFERVQVDDLFGIPYSYIVDCECVRTRRSLIRLRKSGLGDVEKKCTFEQYQTPEKWQAFVKDTAERFCRDDAHSCFFIGGQSGAGKSHICTAIALHYIYQGRELRYLKWLDEIDKIKAMYTEDAARYEATLQRIKEAPVLYIDDLFKTGNGADGKHVPPSHADIKKAFEIIDYRCNRKDMVTIISSEWTQAELTGIDEAVGGRIYEKSKEGGDCLSIARDSRKNWRTKDAIIL